MRNDAIEVRPVATAATGVAVAAIPLVPMLTCVAVGLALAFTPVVVWRMKTGMWVCMQQPETFYYLQIAAQAYYNHFGTSLIRSLPTASRSTHGSHLFR